MPTKKTTHTLDMQQNQIKNLNAPSEGSDAATKTYVDNGLTSKQATITGGASTITTSNLTTSSALVSDTNGKVAASTVSATEVGYLSGVTSAIQTQLTGKANTNHTQAATTVTYSAGAIGGVSFPTSPNATPNNVQLAIENLFQYANSGKTQIANAIGSPAQASDSFSTLAGYISTIGNKTYGVTKQVTLDESITKDDPIESYYKSLTPLKLANPTAPTGALSSAGDIAFSDNGYIAVGTNVSPFHALYFQSGDTITKLENIAGGLPTGQTNGIALSTNATYLAMAHTAGTFLKVFKRRGDEFTSTNVNISATPTGAGRSCAFSNDNQFLAVGQSFTASPVQSLLVYQRTTTYSAGTHIDTFTKLTITDQPPDDVYGVSWSSDGTYLACAHFTTPFVTIYKRSGTTFTKLTVSGGNPTGNAYRVSFSPDDTYVAVAHTTSPFVTVYKRNGDTFTKLADTAFDVSPGNNCRSIAWSPNGVYLGVGIGAGNFQIVYKRIADSFTKQTDPATLPTGTANGFAWSYDAEYYAVGHSTAPFISIYKNNSSTYLFRKINPAGTASINRFDKIIGLAQESGTVGQSKNASILTGGGLLP